MFAVDVEQYGLSVRILGFDLQVALDNVDVVVHLGPGAHGLGRRPPDGRRYDLEAVPVITRPLDERQRVALDDHCGLVAVRRTAHAPGEALGDPVVVIVREQGQICVKYLHRQVGSFVLREARVDTHVLERVVEPVEVLVEAEDMVSEGARGVEDGVAVQEAGVADGHLGPTLGDDLAVHVGDALLSQWVVTSDSSL